MKNAIWMFRLKKVFGILLVIISVLWVASAFGIRETTESRDDTAKAELRILSVDDKRIFSIAIDQINHIVYIGSARGIFKSVDGGENWLDGGLKGLPIWSIAIHPTISTTIYAGSDEGRIYKTIDGGKNWKSIKVNPWNVNIRSLAIDPEYPTIIYAGTEDEGLYKSVDEGESWQKVQGLTNLYITIAIDPSASRRIYAGSLIGIFRSIDRGRIWKLLTGSNKEAPKKDYISSISVDPCSSEIVYYASEKGVFKSTNGGEEWRKTGLKNLYTSSILLDPIHKRIYAGTERGVFMSKDGEKEWFRLNTEEAHITSMAIDSKKDILYALASDGKIFRFTSLSYAIGERFTFPDEALQPESMIREKGINLKEMPPYTLCWLSNGIFTEYTRLDADSSARFSHSINPQLEYQIGVESLIFSSVFYNNDISVCIFSDPNRFSTHRFLSDRFRFVKASDIYQPGSGRIIFGKSDILKILSLLSKAFCSLVERSLWSGPIPSPIMPTIVLALREGEDLTPFGTTCFAPNERGEYRLLVNGRDLKEYSEDRILQAYGSALLKKYNQNYNHHKLMFKPSLDKSTSIEQAWLNGWSYYFSCSIMNTPEVQIKGKVYNLEEVEAKGIDNELAIAKLLWAFNNHSITLHAICDHREINHYGYNVQDFINTVKTYGCGLDRFLDKFGLRPIAKDASLSDSTPTFHIDMNNILSGTVTIKLEISEGYDFDTITASSILSGYGTSTITYTLPYSLADGVYFWRVKVLDENLPNLYSDVGSFGVGIDDCCDAEDNLVNSNYGQLDVRR